METMQLITTEPDGFHQVSEGSADLTTLDDRAIMDFFAEAGLEVDIIDHCADVSCPECFGRRAPRAA
jgi:hypothetical protein